MTREEAIGHAESAMQERKKKRRFKEAVASFNSDLKCWSVSYEFDLADDEVMSPPDVIVLIFDDGRIEFPWQL